MTTVKKPPITQLHDANVFYTVRLCIICSSSKYYMSDDKVLVVKRQKIKKYHLQIRRPVA